MGPATKYPFRAAAGPLTGLLALIASAAHAEPRNRVVLAISPSLAPTLSSQIEANLGSYFGAAGTALSTTSWPAVDSPGALELWMRDLSAPADVRAVFALRASDHDWTLCWTQRQAPTRIEHGCRALRGGLAQDAASVEAVVLMAQATIAELEGGLAAPEEPEPLPAAPPPTDLAIAAAATPVRSRAGRDDAGVVLWLGYRGSHFAPTAAWQEGLSLSLGWMFAAGHFVGAGYTHHAALVVGGATGRFELRHRPFEAQLGQRIARGRLALDLYASLVLEWLSRARGETSATSAATPGDTRVRAGLGVAARGQIRLAGPVGAYLTAGLTGFPSSVRYVSEGGEDQVLFRPHRLPWQLGLGVCLAWP